MKLGLGTVQFGCAYGVSNASGQVSIEEVGKILEYAKSQGVEILDTAQGYGNSEEVLGKFDLSAFKIITKIIGDTDLETSLKNLKQNSIYGLMFHRSEEINDKSWAKFDGYKNQGLVEKIGVSVYTPEELLAVVEKYPIDIVQLPLNLLDQRFLSILPDLKAKNIEIHSRSTFLQGLLLMDIAKVNPYFTPIKPILQSLPQNRVEASLGFVNSIKEVDNIIVGVTLADEFKQIVAALEKDVKIEKAQSFSISDEKFICPQNWRLI